MSRKKTLALSGVLLLVALSAVSCENWCRENGFIPPDECEDPGQPPGPPIVLEPDGSGGLQWKVGGEVETPPDPNGSVYDHCTLRFDFIGINVEEFTYVEKEGGPAISAEKIVVSSPDHNIVIERPKVGGGMIWRTTKETVTGPPVLCQHMEPGEVGSKLPREFFFLAPDSLKHVTNDGENNIYKDIYKMELRVLMPKPDPS